MLIKKKEKQPVRLNILRPIFFLSFFFFHQVATIPGSPFRDSSLVWDELYQNFSLGTSPVVQWLRLRLLMQGLWVQTLVRELRSSMPCGQKNHRSKIVTNSIKTWKWSTWKKVLKKNTKLLFEIPLLRIGPRQSLSPDCLQMILSLQSWLLHILKGVFFFFLQSS